MIGEHRKEAIEAAVRQVAAEYLEDPNITSVGLGYRVKDGERTQTPTLQFTVGEKFAPEALEAAGTRPIPAAITVNGIQFETDVVERRFEPHAIAVAQLAKDERKQRLDPAPPGVSIGNVRITAGTLGCLVRDRASGELRLLSNWHVFQGADGRLGDAVVQPGPYDDNRVAGNQVAVLDRSFLGLAGDCALGRPTGRALTEDILELGVAVRAVADPKLGDRLVKSGRTTGVTYGVVTRIHTIVKMSYGPGLDEQIGAFELGPDDAHPAPNGEISQGGDSGSAWMATDAEDQPTSTMAGLHSAGETVEPAEYALACYASSVFTKLEVVPIADGELPAAARQAQPGPAGYDPDFLPGVTIDVPAAAYPEVQRDYALTHAGEPLRRYTHYTVALSTQRRFARWVAWNVDGAAIKMLSRTGIPFTLDSEFDPAQQVGDELYSNNRLDRGHIARRADLIWGDLDEAQAANHDSFYFPNITPQLDDFNQEAKGGLWGKLEDAIFADVEVEHLRVSLFGGAIFTPSDLEYRGVLVPRSFWKLIAYLEGGVLRAWSRFASTRSR
jgi:endonuclease G